MVIKREYRAEALAADKVRRAVKLARKRAATLRKVRRAAC